MVVSAQPVLTPHRGLGRPAALLWLGAATALAAAFRFYNLGWGAPYFHFHIDEHFVFTGAYLLSQDPKTAAMSAKFFMYPPLPMYLLDVVVYVYQAFAHPLDLTVPRDEVTFMVLGRAVSATLGTATIPLVYLIATRVAGRLAGVLAAVLLACSVLHLRDSHFFTTDPALAFFSTLTWWCLVRTVERGDTASEVQSGVAFGLSLLSKYTAVFLAPLVALAHLLSPNRPNGLRPVRPWLRWMLRAALPLIIAFATFVILDPLVWKYYAKFRTDFQEQITDPLLGVTRPQFFSQFADVQPQVFWFTNLLWFAMGPAFEAWSLIGVAWLFARRDRVALMAAAFPVVFWLFAARSVAPFPRYAIPLMPALAVTAAALSADWLRRPRLRPIAAVATFVVVTTTAIWAVAYMNVFRSPDSRLTASAWLLANVPRDAKILIEPSHGIPPMGSYLTSVDFHRNYVLFYPQTEKHDYYQLYALDTYRSLYNRGVDDEYRRNYIQSRLALADWIVMDDQYLQQYSHLPESEHGVVKQYYRDLFDGRLGFQLVQTFKVYPAIFGWTINDDAAELTFRSFDHPRVFIFRRK
jgi:4-amino-4-deoxy-L-arabinose transferase-like glycosyltransferase